MHFTLCIMHFNPIVNFICATALYEWLPELLYNVVFSVVVLMYFVFCIFVSLSLFVVSYGLCYLPRDYRYKLAILLTPAYLHMQLY